MTLRMCTRCIISQYHSYYWFVNETLAFSLSFHFVSHIIIALHYINTLYVCQKSGGALAPSAPLLSTPLLTVRNWEVFL